MSPIEDNTRALSTPNAPVEQREAIARELPRWLYGVADEDEPDEWDKLVSSQRLPFLYAADAILAVRLDEAADRIKEVIDEAGQEGAAAGWKPCSGCYETEDGHPVGEYRHSKQFGCAVGGGCDECGGLGVVWEYHSASDLAWLEKQLTEPDPSSLDEAVIRKDEREKCADDANGIEPELLKNKSEHFVSIYCAARVDASTAIRNGGKHGSGFEAAIVDTSAPTTSG